MLNSTPEGMLSGVVLLGGVFNDEGCTGINIEIEELLFLEKEQPTQSWLYWALGLATTED